MQKKWECKRDRKKKAALLLAFFAAGAVCGGADSSTISRDEFAGLANFVDIGVQKASADAEHPDIFIGYSNSETFGENGEVSTKSSSNYYVSWSPDKNRYVVRVNGYSSRRGRAWLREFDDIELTESTFNGKTTEGRAVQAAAKAVMEALNHGVSITDVRKMMQDSGIDGSGPIINISKPMNTKDIHVDGSITTTGGIEAGGDIHGESNLTIDGDTHLKGNAEIDKDLIVHGTQTVDGDSSIHGNQTIDKNLHVKGDATLDGKLDVDDDAHIKGNAEIDKDLTVHGGQAVDGDSTIHGNQTVDKNLHVKGDTTLDGKLDVDGDSHLHGNAEIDKDLAVHGNQTVDGDSTIRGNQTIDKNLTVGGDTDMKGNARVEKDLTVNGNAEVDKNLHVKGDTRVDGDIYGRSFNVGDERYIDKDGINANNHKIRNVADGDISSDSLDAVNGRQLYHTREELRHNINQVSAQAAAMANLHPIEYNEKDKVSVSAAVGGHKDQQALAIGAYYRPNKKSMISLSGTLGNNDNMYGIGFSQRFGEDTSEGDTDKKVEELQNAVEMQKQEIASLKEKAGLVDTLKAQVDALMQKIKDKF